MSSTSLTKKDIKRSSTTATLKRLCIFFDHIEGKFGFKIKDMKNSIRLNISNHPHDFCEGRYVFHSTICDGTRRSDEFCDIEHPTVVSILPYNCYKNKN